MFEIDRKNFLDFYRAFNEDGGAFFVPNDGMWEFVALFLQSINKVKTNSIHTSRISNVFVKNFGM